MILCNPDNNTDYKLEKTIDYLLHFNQCEEIHININGCTSFSLIHNGDHHIASYWDDKTIRYFTEGAQDALFIDLIHAIIYDLDDSVFYYTHEFKINYYDNLNRFADTLIKLEHQAIPNHEKHKPINNSFIFGGYKGESL